jgi:uroporphyrinogen decarboxylase
MLQLFDSWAGELTPYQFQTFALPPLLKISELLRSKLNALSIPVPPVILFAKGANTSLSLLSTYVPSHFDVLSLDWCITPQEARSLVGQHVGLQGNADPMSLYGGKSGIEDEVKRVCKGFLEVSGTEGKAPKGWISNLGHGMTPEVDPEDMRWYLECVQKYSARKE